MASKTATAAASPNSLPALTTVGGLGTPREAWAFEELQDEGVVLGERRHDARADARLGGRDRVVDLVLAVDRKEARVLAGDPDDVGPGRRRDLVVRVREAARERLGRAAAQLRNGLQDVLERHLRRSYEMD